LQEQQQLLAQQAAERQRIQQQQEHDHAQGRGRRRVGPLDALPGVGYVGVRTSVRRLLAWELKMSGLDTTPPMVTDERFSAPVPGDDPSTNCGRDRASFARHTGSLNPIVGPKRRVAFSSGSKRTIQRQRKEQQIDTTLETATAE